MRGPSLPVAAVVLALALAAPATATAPPTRAQQLKAVVHAWSARLNAGDNAGVARLFALPAVVVQGSYAFRFDRRSQLVEWHSGLPCAGEIVSIAIHGQNAVAVFRLADRRGSKCDAPGTLAAARFRIVGGKIVLWVQVPVPAEQAGGGTIA